MNPTLICKSFKCYRISNSQNSKEDYLIFDYNQFNQQTNSCNYIYIHEELNNISNNFSIIIEESPSVNIDENLNISTSNSLNTNISKILNVNIN
ncbi:1411_t:CDS:2 [Scutellospora calospora]|uniref:1411_t:CDS:1 n=1 Tax=Scutellospora calospora TaxID=85575 RepID=A0ACA9JTU4_9GLOM|nr:1411_t:CDS:2 [Scutellospora calospora]